MAGRYPFPAVPDGWFGVAGSDDVAVRQVMPVHLLDTELVLFRDDSGVARVFDAYCPHLGAHLGVGGTVCGDGLTCPFHGWRLAGDGSVAEVPKVARPPKVGTRAWDVCEANGRVFVWHHAGGLGPRYDVTPYRTDGESWTPWRVDTYRVRVHVQELTENIIDRAHFVVVHDMVEPDVDRFDVRFEDHSMVVDQHVKVTAVVEGGVEVKTRTTTCGPGIVAVEVKDGELDMLTYITQTPVDDEFTDITICFSMRALDDEVVTASISELNAKTTNLQFAQDIAIWENKIYREKPILTQADGPVAEYRRWFRQFYSGWT
ncbi:MAG: Rieske 2Fe-2S domain-containing protein [Frankiaceae bacterium]|nr:Rieske 2Fe-2S domain-containing protein [Frankiaceae bacterium]